MTMARSGSGGGSGWGAGASAVWGRAGSVNGRRSWRRGARLYGRLTPGLGAAAGRGTGRGWSVRPTGQLGDDGVVLDVEAGEHLPWRELLGQHLVRFVDTLVQRVERAGRHVDADRREPLRLEARLAVRRDAHL